MRRPGDTLPSRLGRSQRRHASPGRPRRAQETPKGGQQVSRVSPEAARRGPGGPKTCKTDGFYDVWLWGALGVGRTHLQGTQEALKITAPQQPIITVPAAQIMQDRLGWALPLDAMGAWLAGAPASSLSMSSSISDAAGRLQQITQADWTITFADHRQVDGQWRPERIVIKGKGLTLDVSIRHPRAVMT